MLYLYDVKNIIVGHTPQSFITDEGINSTCNNKVWRVDIGVSDAFSIYDDDLQMRFKSLAEKCGFKYGGHKVRAFASISPQFIHKHADLLDEDL